MSDRRIGTMVADRYRLERVLQKGGMGVVYAATHTWTERQVALKVLLPAIAEDATLIQRFFQEAKVAASVRHPNVIDVLDMGEDDDGSAFLALELLEGESLRDRLGRDGRLSPADTLRILLPIIDALHAVHARGVIHRDIKPANVFLSRARLGGIVPKLLDFGVAKLLEDARVQTITGSMVGTPCYMSPEQAKGIHEITATSDVWSMGVLMTRTMTGKMPVEPNPNPTMVLMAVLTEDRPKVTELDPDAPPSIAAVLDGCFSRDVSGRFPSMDALLEALLQAARADGVEVLDPRELERASVPGGGAR